MECELTEGNVKIIAARKTIPIESTEDKEQFARMAPVPQSALRLNWKTKGKGLLKVCQGWVTIWMGGCFRSIAHLSS